MGEKYNPSLQMTDSLTRAKWVEITTCKLCNDFSHVQRTAKGKKKCGERGGKLTLQCTNKVVSKLGPDH